MSSTAYSRARCGSTYRVRTLPATRHTPARVMQARRSIYAPDFSPEYPRPQPLKSPASSPSARSRSPPSRHARSRPSPANPARTRPAYGRRNYQRHPSLPHPARLHRVAAEHQRHLRHQNQPLALQSPEPPWRPRHHRLPQARRPTSCWNKR